MYVLYASSLLFITYKKMYSCSINVVITSSYNRPSVYLKPYPSVWGDGDMAIIFSLLFPPIPHKQGNEENHNLK